MTRWRVAGKEKSYDTVQYDTCMRLRGVAMLRIWTELSCKIKQREQQGKEIRKDSKINNRYRENDSVSRKEKEE